MVTISFRKIFIYGFIPLLFFQGCRKAALPKEDAVNCLKVLNSDIINFFDNAAQRPEIKALQFIQNQESIPIPFKSFSSGMFFNPRSYNFEANMGKYIWNDETNEFVKIKDTSLVFLSFSLNDNEPGKCEFSFANYSSEKIDSQPDFPLSFDASVKVGNIEELNIKYRADVVENLPASIIFEANARFYSFKYNFRRKGSVHQKSGKILCSADLESGFAKLVQFQVQADINYHNTTYSFQHIKINSRMFQTEFSGTVNYGEVDPTCSNYAESFNDNCDLTLWNSGRKKTIGNIILDPVEGSDQLDFFIRYKDQSTDRLSDHLLLLKKILNLKY